MSEAHVIVFADERIPYEIVRTDRRTLALTVARDGTVRVRAPRWVPRGVIERFVSERASWVARKRVEVTARCIPGRTPLTPDELARARIVLDERLRACWAAFAGPGETLPPLRVREMKSRWGSLGSTGRVTLNAVLVRAPVAYIDYVVYHELCHLRVRGHGPSFYAELARYVPEWRTRRRELAHLV